MNRKIRTLKSPRYEAIFYPPSVESRGTSLWGAKRCRSSDHVVGYRIALTLFWGLPSIWHIAMLAMPYQNGSPYHLLCIPWKFTDETKYSLSLAMYHRHSDTLALPDRFLGRTATYNFFVFLVHFRKQSSILRSD